MSLKKPTPRTVSDKVELAAVLGSYYDNLKPLSGATISPERMPALRYTVMAGIDEMRSIRGDAAGLTGPRGCIVVGKYEVLDGWEGIFFWDATSRADDDDLNVIESPAAGIPAGAPGRWLRKIDAATRIDVFTASGTWTNRGGVVSFYGIGCGASGGAGERGAVNPAGGGGGSGGGYAEATGLDVSLLPATIAVTIGTPGASVAGRGTDGAGANGNDGGACTVAGVLSALGGNKGNGGNSGFGGLGGASVQGSGAGGSGAVGTDGNGGSAATAARGPGGGGGGAGPSGANAKGGDGGLGSRFTGVPIAGGAGVAGAAGGNGSSGTAGLAFGGGGAAGGGVSAGGTAFNGGSGGSYGAGGGGGASCSAGTSGASGAGGPGIVVAVTTGPTS